MHLRGENRLSRKVLHSHVIITDVMNSGAGSTLVVSTIHLMNSGRTFQCLILENKSLV